MSCIPQRWVCLCHAIHDLATCAVEIVTVMPTSFVLTAPRASPQVQKSSPTMMNRNKPKLMNNQAAAGGDAHLKIEELTTQVSWHLLTTGEGSVLGSRCLSVRALNPKTLTPIDLFFYTRSSIPVDRSSSNFIVIRIWTQEFIKGDWTKYDINVCHDVKRAL